MRFAEILLGAKVVDEEPPPGTFVYDLRRLVQDCSEGRITNAELQAELRRLHPWPYQDVSPDRSPPLDAGGEAGERF